MLSALQQHSTRAFVRDRCSWHAALPDPNLGRQSQSPPVPSTLPGPGRPSQAPKPQLPSTQPAARPSPSLKPTQPARLGSNPPQQPGPASSSAGAQRSPSPNPTPPPAAIPRRRNFKLAEQQAPQSEQPPAAKPPPPPIRTSSPISSNNSGTGSPPAKPTSPPVNNPLLSGPVQARPASSSPPVSNPLLSGPSQPSRPASTSTSTVGRLSTSASPSSFGGSPHSEPAGSSPSPQQPRAAPPPARRNPLLYGESQGGSNSSLLGGISNSSNLGGTSGSPGLGGSPGRGSVTASSPTPASLNGNNGNAVVSTPSMAEHARLVQALAQQLQLQAMVVEQGRRTQEERRRKEAEKKHQAVKPPVASQLRTPLNAASQKLCRELTQLLQDSKGPFDPEATVNNTRALIRMYQQVPSYTFATCVQPMLDALVDALLMDGMQGFTVRQTTQVVHAVSRLPCQSGHSHMLLETAMEHLRALGLTAWLSKDVIPTTISTILGAYAAASYKRNVQPLVSGVSLAVESGSMRFSDAHTWSNTLLATAKLRIPTADMPYVWSMGTAAVTQAILEATSAHRRGPSAFKAPTITPQDIANTLWACGKSGYKDIGELTSAVTVAVEAGLMDRLKPQDWAANLVAAAKLKVPASAMLPFWRKGVQIIASAFLQVNPGGTPARINPRLVMLQEEKPLTPLLLLKSLWACASAGYRPGVNTLASAFWHVVLTTITKALGWVKGLVLKDNPPASPQVAALGSS